VGRFSTIEKTHGLVEALEGVLSYLVGERQQLRSHGAPPAELEANRLAIVAIQWQLTRALGEGYSPTPAPEAHPVSS
jgi:hypothetical protein